MRPGAALVLFCLVFAAASGMAQPAQPIDELPPNRPMLKNPVGPPALPEILDPIKARHQIFDELDRMTAHQLLQFHEGILYGHRDKKAVDAILSDPPVLATVRAELESFVATGDDTRTLYTYEALRAMRRHERDAFKRALDRLQPPPADEPTGISAAHEDGDGESWTNRDCRESPPNSQLMRDHLSSVNTAAQMLRDLCVKNAHRANCSEHQHRWFDACWGESTDPRVNPHCQGHLNDMLRCWRDNG